ncbi:MAG: TIGR03936 family radical SAM-associated protein [Anaerolineae bacterium]|nr:TIGR03936 family radical SAM-associated protein [Anaerolineae bacterium]
MRIRLSFAKAGPLTYVSHLDLVRIWERSLRRAGVPLAYSGGFNPRPRLQLAAALPVGHTGGAELLDVWLERPVELEKFGRALVPVLPLGLTIGEVYLVPPQAPALQTQVIAAEYRVTAEWDAPAAQVEERIHSIMAMTELPQMRRGKAYDLRPLIERLWLEDYTAGSITLGMQLAAREGATARPEAVLEALGIGTGGERLVRYHRKRLILTNG